MCPPNSVRGRLLPRLLKLKLFLQGAHLSEDRTPGVAEFDAQKGMD
jgi:hypothetical protein